MKYWSELQTGQNKIDLTGSEMSDGNDHYSASLQNLVSPAVGVSTSEKELPVTGANMMLDYANLEAIQDS
jgi:hypothetical protein